MNHFHCGCTGRTPLIFDSSRCPACARPESGLCRCDQTHVVARQENSPIEDRLALTRALKALNRSMGLEDAYPFALNEAVRTKLDWIGQLIASRRVLH